MFLHSLTEILPNVRTFAFSNKAGEVTDLFENKDIEETVDISIPKSHFIENNEILSLSYLKRYFSYEEITFPFSTNYALTVCDSNLNSVTINTKQYILLLKDGYTVEDIK